MVGVCFWVSYMVLLFSSFTYAKTKCGKGCRCLDTFIDCASKGLITVPQNIPKWAAHLEMNRNKLTVIEPLTFHDFEQLKILKLKRNQINTLKDGAFYGLKKIEKLLLDNNYITVITKGWLYGLESLKELSLSHNHISQINDDAWEFCDTLAALDISFNNLDSIKEDTFKNLASLQKLNLNSNNIMAIKDTAFSHLPKLKSLYLNNNRIYWTIEDGSGVFQGLDELTRFHLMENNITSINSNAFLGLKNVTYINLANNNITSVQNNAFYKVPALKQLLINSTSLLCDRNLKWFLEWLSLKNITLQASCGYPDWLRGMLISNISASNLTWDELPKPRLIEEPALEIMALKGKNVTLNCKAVSSSTSNMTFLWRKDNEELINPNVKVMSRTYPDGKSVETSSVLNLFSVDNSHAGKYQCVVSNSYGTTYSVKSLISVLVYPTFLKTPKNVQVQAGETAKLECAATGEPPPEVAWHKDGGNDFPAATERRMHVLPADDVFFIVNVSPIDAGVYSCTAHNAAGIATADAKLEVLQKPHVIKGPEDRELAAGEPIVLQCMVQGVPKPTITWFKDNEPLVATERHFIIAENQVIVIVDSFHNDSGIYECHLNNSLGQEIGRSRIIIKPSVLDTSNILGIIIIAVVCCAVITSLIWVAIIYQTHRSSCPKEPTPIHPTELPESTDCASERSSCKDSGTGDSARRSSDDFEFSVLLHSCPRSDHDRLNGQACEMAEKIT
ncbi:leucine-rich repeats and immunoglobulin-like domains protein lambik [Rhynchophorus ferrugineus]|uniref:leucine-rich repeats and immunoglobulin-like domains protein lambik n=1 Tax=Rhynchophorus ferrugineus TaxID=354439 RepID=UPI003FCC8A2B